MKASNKIPKYGRPKLKRKDKKVQICFSIVKSELDRFHKLLAYKGTTRSDLIGKLIIKYNDEQEEIIKKGELK